jgi:hypothetical protein
MLEIPDDVRAELIADAAELDTLTGQSFSASWFGEPPTGAPKDA